MQEIKTLEELKFYLTHFEIITRDGKDSFYLKDGIVTHKFNSNVYRVDYDTFLDLYKDVTFYLKEEEQETVDDKKDEEYYGRIQKSN